MRSDALNLKKIFPGCTLVSRAEADAVVGAYFRAKGLKRCMHLRESLVFGLKLFDPFFFSKRDWFVLLDSDVLFFQRPSELLSASDHALQNRYLVDNGYRYCLEREELSAMLGKECIERLNPGILCVRSDVLNCERIEQYLVHPRFWNEDGSGNYYAELTLWAMELTLAGALPLSRHYAICPCEFEPGLVAGHYCGGGYWASLFYSRGLPYLAKIFLNSDSVGSGTRG
jgi:hypothetical protein